MLSVVRQSTDILPLQSNTAGDWGSTRLDDLIHGLADVDRITEQSFLALGSQIQGFHGRAHGISQGAGLDVIAQNIQVVAEEACRHALTLAKKCETITEHARNLQNVEQETNASTDNVRNLLQEAQKRMENLDVSCLQLADLAGTVDRDATVLSEEVLSIVHTIDIGEIFQGELAPVLEQLGTLSWRAGEGTSDFDNTSLDILFNELELCYTMASERKLHQSFLDSQRLTAPGDLSTPGDLTEEDEWSKSRKHDLGDNVDLF